MVLIGLSNPPHAVWLSRKIPVYLVRFYNDLIPTRTSRPIAEHVYKPSGMYRYVKGKPIIYHYLYEQTRFLKPHGGAHVAEEEKLSELRGSDERVQAPLEPSSDGGTA